MPLEERTIQIDHVQDDMLYLGLDITLNSSGVALLIRGHATTYTVRPPASVGRHAARLTYTYDAVLDIVRTCMPVYASVRHCGIEGGSYNSKGRLFQLGEASGAATVAAAPYVKVFTSIPPASLKLYWTRNKNAPKPRMIKTANTRFGLEDPFVECEDDMVDALACACVAHDLNYIETLVLRHQLEALKPLVATPVEISKDYKLTEPAWLLT